jgi:hypothetical protein
MSWDIHVQDLPPGIADLSDVASDFEPQPLGTRAALIERISTLVPGADFSDPTWGRVDGPGYSIEISLGSRDPVEGFAFHVRGGDLAVGVVADILDDLGLCAIDPGSSTGLFSRDDAAGSLERWRQFRDAVVGET